MLCWWDHKSILPINLFLKKLQCFIEISTNQSNKKKNATRLLYLQRNFELILMVRSSNKWWMFVGILMKLGLNSNKLLMLFWQFGRGMPRVLWLLFVARSMQILLIFWWTPGPFFVVETDEVQLWFQRFKSRWETDENAAMNNFSVIHRKVESNLVVTKGACTYILALCTHIGVFHHTMPFTFSHTRVNLLP